MSLAIFGFSQNLRPLPPLPAKVIPRDPCCRLKKATSTRQCLRCAKDFRVQASQVARGSGLYCSHDCAHKHRHQLVVERMKYAVLSALRDGGLSAVQIADRAGVSRPTALRHLYDLERDRVAVSQPRTDADGRRVHGVGWWLAEGYQAQPAEPTKGALPTRLVPNILGLRETPIDEVAAELGPSRATVERIEQVALRKLAVLPGIESLRVFLEGP